MPAPSSDALGRLAFYYGAGGLDELARFDAVVLQPTNYAASEVAELVRRGVRPVAYLSVGEDTGPWAPWQRAARNPDWGGAHVRLSHPGWAEALASRASSALERGFLGLFLDTLDVVDLYPDDRAALLRVLGSLRRLVDAGRGRRRVLLANRGFALLPELAKWVDSVVFEAFSCSWLAAGGCAPLGAAELQRNVVLARLAQASGVPVVALDYVDRPMLEAFARHRARLHGLGWAGARERTLSTFPTGFLDRDEGDGQQPDASGGRREQGC